MAYCPLPTPARRRTGETAILWRRARRAWSVHFLGLPTRTTAEHATCASSATITTAAFSESALPKATVGSSSPFWASALSATRLCLPLPCAPGCGLRTVAGRTTQPWRAPTRRQPHCSSSSASSSVSSACFRSRAFALASAPRVRVCYGPSHARSSGVLRRLLRRKRRRTTIPLRRRAAARASRLSTVGA